MEQYETWIANCKEPKGAGNCHARSKEMQQAFPELILCRGYYTSELDGMPSHWWLKTPDGRIVDPTVGQFQMGKEGCYEEYNEKDHGPLPIGKCMNCGDLTYAGDSCCCSVECEKALNS
jgi:hypothetical protein